MNVYVKQVYIDGVKIFTDVTNIHINSNVLWIEEYYNNQPLFIVENIKEITQIKSFLSF